MLFNSYSFIFVFLPISLIGSLLVRHFWGYKPFVIVLSAFSLIFYSYWNYKYTSIIIASIIFNLLISRWLQKAEGNLRLALLSIGIVCNLGLLGFFKYLGFITANLNGFFNTGLPIMDLVLPIGISFYTFQQIAFLVDIYRRELVENNPWRYLLFVLFFPQLIAGPIVHHQEMMSQFRMKKRNVWGDLSVGSSIFSIGLAKKVLIADTFALLVSPVFEAAAKGIEPNLLMAWIALLCYTLQIYFDFSGYSDMAIGIGRMFGIKLPTNFSSPYKSTSIIEFWRRWHITLSRFLRDYLYFPIGGGRQGKTRRMVNIYFTMLIGGIWHGAGWTFVLWGVIHGGLIVINHLWRGIGRYIPGNQIFQMPVIAWSLTFICVALAWVPFRSPDIDATLVMYKSLAGVSGISLPRFTANFVSQFNWFKDLGIVAGGIGLNNPFIGYLMLPMVLIATIVMPNTQTIFKDYEPSLSTDGYLSDRMWVPKNFEVNFRFGTTSAIGLALLLAACFLKLGDVSEFIYFQF